MLTEQVHGHTPERPTRLGQANGADAVQVYATGLFQGVRKGDVRWVTGDLVEVGLDSGVLVLVDNADDDSLADIGRTADRERAAARDHVASPPGAMFEPRTHDPDGPAPVATEVDVQLAELSKSDLLTLARAVDLPGRTGMDKGELYEHLRKHPDIADHLA